jgi:phosphopantetheinyl transferase (holo-ACP synthase)
MGAPVPYPAPLRSGEQLSMPKPRNLGNDIVALTSPRCRDKVQDSRFLDRVFSEGEQEAILTNKAPDTTLWLHWAGKESIFKSATKALGSPPTFHHNAFRVSFPEAGSPAPTAVQGTGFYRDLSFHLKAEIHPDFLHVVAWEVDRPGVVTSGNVLQWQVVQGRDPRSASMDDLRQGLSSKEWDCVSHNASALTRLSAKAALAKALEVGEGRVEIRCGNGRPGRRVPLVFVDGKERPLDLTLSHDAHLMAWAFLLGEGNL